jgi:S1-C subfamily serine protease
VWPDATMAPMSFDESLPPVVRIFATTQAPDFECPWQAQAPEACTGSGVVVGDRHILTGAHVVANGTFLQVQRLSEPDKVTARVRSVCHDADLALLEVDDPSFTEGIAAPAIGDLPGFSDRVSVVGFPIGGEEISVTEGVVSRLELQSTRPSTPATAAGRCSWTATSAASPFKSSATPTGSARWCRPP